VRALLAAASFLLSACGGTSARTPESAPPAALAAGPAASGWDLVYEHVIGGNQDLYVVSGKGGLPRRLTDHPATDGLPRFSPDGVKVLFTSERSGNWQIWEVPWQGGEARRVRTNPHTGWQIDLSPDGRRLTFLSNQEGAEHLWLMDVATGQQRALVRHGKSSILGNPHWSRDGTRIIYSSNWRLGHHVRVVDVASGEDRRVSAVTAGGCEPRFHPDGKRFVYVRRGHMSEKSRLVEIDLASGDETTLVDWPALNYDPVYSPDGSEVAFASNITGEYAIYRQRLSDGKSWRVTHAAGAARYPDYRPTR
jgi:Tol biopolymer transport system component